MKRRRVISFITVLALCLNLCPAWGLAIDRASDDGLCPHHQAHTESCGYVPESTGASCTFACRVCPIEDLTGKLPRSVTPDNQAQVEEQLREILTLYSELTAEEQEQLDLSPCLSLQTQLDAADTPMPTGSFTPRSSGGRLHICFSSAYS